MIVGKIVNGPECGFVKHRLYRHLIIDPIALENKNHTNVGTQIKKKFEIYVHDISSKRPTLLDKDFETESKALISI